MSAIYVIHDEYDKIRMYPLPKGVHYAAVHLDEQHVFTADEIKETVGRLGEQLLGLLKQEDAA